LGDDHGDEDAPVDIDELVRQLSAEASRLRSESESESSDEYPGFDETRELEMARHQVRGPSLRC
jgi:hypothetical protein